MVMCQELSAEWARHRSRFAFRWRRQMYARKKVVRLELESESALRRRVRLCGLEGKRLVAIEKDLHLLEAALASDSIVASLDREAKVLFASAAGAVREIASVVWVNPCVEEEDLHAWLAAGAPYQSFRTLAE